MKEGYIIRDQEKIHFITATVVDWIDACLPAWQVFTRKTYKAVVIESLAYCIKRDVPHYFWFEKSRNETN